MSHDIRCPDCGGRFSQDEFYMDHLIRNHQARVREYLTDKSPVITCPGGCCSLFDAKTLNPSTICPKDGYRIAITDFDGQLDL